MKFATPFSPLLNLELFFYQSTFQIWEASYIDQINVTKNGLEYDQKN